MNIEQAVENIKGFISDKNLVGQIRSGKIIDEIHETVKYNIQEKLLAQKVNKPIILPPIKEHKKGELQLAGFIKRKTQDICITPNLNKEIETLGGIGLLGEEDEFGLKFTERTLSINVRSQISKITANTDTLFERTYAEALNLHLRCSNMVLGEVYLLSAFDNNLQKYLTKETIKRYIKFFHSISNRKCLKCNTRYANIEPYKYEAICLLIVDFNQLTPKIYNSTKELINDGFLDENTTVRYEGLEWGRFFEKILDIYNQRFGLQNLNHNIK